MRMIRKKPVSGMIGDGNRFLAKIMRKQDAHDPEKWEPVFG